MSKTALFMHIPKTAGISLYKAIRHPEIKIKGHFIQNPFHRYLKDTLPHYKNKPYVFTFVRNPWDRLVSAFFYLNQGGRNHSDKSDSRKYLKKYHGNFETFVKKGIGEGKVFEQLHLKPQYVWICNDEGNLLTDYIGHFESLQEDLDRISKETGILFEPLDHHNSSSHKHYYDYYNDETQAIVAKAYKKDIELFGYQF